MLPVRLPGPSDLLDLPWTLADSVRSLSAALPRAEGLLPLADDVLRRTRSLLDGAGPAVARAAAVGPEAVEVAADAVRRIAAVATPERVEAVIRAVDTLRSRADVVPRVLDAFDGLLSSGRLDRLADGLDRLLAA